MSLFLLYKYSSRVYLVSITVLLIPTPLNVSLGTTSEGVKWVLLALQRTHDMTVPSLNVGTCHLSALVPLSGIDTSFYYF